MFLRILTVVCLSSLQLSESLTVQIEGNKTSFTFPSETTSEIKFYIRDGKDFRVFVQHKALEKDSYSTICFVSQSASSGCVASNNICRCPKDADGAFSLNKTFQQSDAGLWMFTPWQHVNVSKTVTVSVVDYILLTKSPFILPTSQALDETTQVSTDVLSQTSITSTLSKSLTLQIEGNKTNFTFPLGVTSQIKFYVRSETDFRIYIQHKATEKDSYNMKCVVFQSASKGCNTSNNICRCPEDTDGAFSLNKTFQQSDAGLWMFSPVKHVNVTKTVNVSVVDRQETPNNSVDSPENKENGKDHETGTSLSYQSEEDNDVENTGSEFVSMNSITISFLVIASQWGLM